MTRPKVVFNDAAVQRVLKSTVVRAKLRAIAERIAEAVDDQGLQAESGWDETGDPAAITATVTESTDSDRARVTVSITHPAAKAMQAKHGVMTKAASAAGVTPHT